jgi:hypothetical protein
MRDDLISAIFEDRHPVVNVCEDVAYTVLAIAHLSALWSDEP